MKSILHKLVNESQIDEMGIRRVERLSGSHIGRERQETVNYARQQAGRPVRRSYEEVAVELKRALKEVVRTDITMEKPGGSRYYYPRFPQAIVQLLQEAKQIDERKMREDFGRWRDVYPDDSGAVHFATDSPADFQRSHFPDGGIQPSLRGIGLGYKLYRSLLKTAGYISSNSAGTREKDKTWGSLLSYKQNPDGSPSVDDAHAIIGSGSWMAIDKGFAQSSKLSRAMDFIEQKIVFSNTEPNKFDVDDELLALFPDTFLVKLSPTYLRSLIADNRISQEKFDSIIAAASQAERAERERQAARAQAEREAMAQREETQRRAHAARIAKYGADMDADWNVGDFIVVRGYLLQDYDTLPIRQVIAQEGQAYKAVYLRDAIRIANGTMTLGSANDVRSVTNKAEWVKVNLEAIPDLNVVNLNPEEKAYVQTLISPERREALNRERKQRDRDRLDREAAANAERRGNEGTYGLPITNLAELSTALSQRASLENFALINSFKSGGAGVRIIAMTTQQVNSSSSRSSDVFVPFMPSGRRGGRPVGPEEFARSMDRIRLINLVTGHVIEPPLAGLDLTYYILDEVSRDEKRRVRGGDAFYIANHRNVFGVLGKAEYGTRNTQDQPFIYMNVFGSNQRPTAVRLDLLRKLSRPFTIEELSGGAYENQ